MTFFLYIFFSLACSCFCSNWCKTCVVSIFRFVSYFTYEGLVSKEFETVMQRRWGSKTLNFGIKQVHKGHVFTLRRQQS